MDWWAGYVGTPYSDFNCWALIRKVYREILGIELPSFSDIPPRDYRSVTSAMERNQALWLEADGKKPFDIALMRVHRLVNHVGVVTRPGWILHTAH